VVDDEKLGAGPSLESARIRSVGDGGVEIVEEVDAARVTHADPLPAGLEGEGFEDVALAGAGFSGDDDIVTPTDEVEARELADERLVELRLEVEVEGFESLVLLEAAPI